MSVTGRGMKCNILEWMKGNTLKWFGHFDGMKSEEFVKKMHVSETDGPKRTWTSKERVYG